MIALAISNVFTITSDCDNLLIAYRNNFDAYGFDYESDDTFYQQVRIGAYLRSDKPDVKEKIYRLSNGRYRRGNTFIDKSVELHTDLIDEHTRDALSVALKHSDFKINNKDYFCYGNLSNEDNEFNNLANMTATLYDQDFNASNIQC
jgi:hypothetical protein